MSDTPRTDAAWSSGFDPVILSAAELARRLREQCADLERENAALKEELAPLRETVGVRGDAVTSRDDIAYWCKLMDRADKADRLERENAELQKENAALRSLLREAITDHVSPYDLPESEDYIARVRAALGQDKP